MSDKNPETVYLDSCTYLDYLKGDHALHDQMQLMMDDWKAGNVRLVTSALTIAEVLWVKCDEDTARAMVDRSREPEIVALFEPPREQPFTLVEVTRVTAMAARELVWDYGVKPKDAIHIASALAAHCPVFYTNDGRLQKFSEKVKGAPVLRIEAPTWTKQTVLDLPDDPAPPAPAS